MSWLFGDSGHNSEGLWSAEYLTENRYTILIASRGSEALEIAERHEEPIHLMLTDLVMPKMSGRDLAERIKVSHPETMVVFMSGYSNNLLSNQQILDPKHVLLQKPFRRRLWAFASERS